MQMTRLAPSKTATRERLQVMRLFVSGMNTMAIARFMEIPEPDVERIIHTRMCRDMQREIRSLKDLLEAIE